MPKYLLRWFRTEWAYHRHERLFPGGSIPLYHPDLGVLIYGSPKAASTVTTAIFFQAVGELDNALALNSFVHKYEHQVYKQRSGYVRDVIEAIYRETTPAIKIVRDPLARALSMYLELTRLGAIVDRKGTEHPWFYDYRRRITEEVHGTDDPYHGFSFLEFLEWRARQENDRINRHLQEQTRPVLDALLEPTVIQAERMREDLEPYPRLAEAYRVVETRGLLSSNHHKAKAEMPDEEAWHALNSRVYCGLMPPLSLKRCPAPELRQLLERAFPRDMETIAPLYERTERPDERTGRPGSAGAGTPIGREPVQAGHGRTALHP